MKIDYSNAQIVNSPDFYIHDDWFVNMNYEYKEKCMDSINIHLSKCYEVNDYNVKFNNVIGFEGTSCRFWGLFQEKCINYIEFVKEEEQTLIPKLYELKEKEPNVNDSCPILSDKKFIEISIGFLNGDTLTIACESLEVDDDMVAYFPFRSK